MDRYIFPAIFQKENTGEILIRFPDLPGCITEGKDSHDAFIMAKEAMELHIWGMEEDGEEIPKPSDPYTIHLTENSFLGMIDVWMPMVRDEMSNRAIKKTLTIPKWLNDIALENRVNFSQVLQTALKKHLGL
ncbi:MAG: type II toxin-antitoxin system HicB family antitoxin [Clostridia bacterium]|nr:type II toxin-antitoxin system HicB family antitoxin [Clostridia bacterium]